MEGNVGITLSKLNFFIRILMGGGVKCLKGTWKVRAFQRGD